MFPRQGIHYRYFPSGETSTRAAGEKGQKRKSPMGQARSFSLFHVCTYVRTCKSIPAPLPRRERERGGRDMGGIGNDGRNGSFPIPSPPRFPSPPTHTRGVVGGEWRRIQRGPVFYPRRLSLSPPLFPSVCMPEDGRRKRMQNVAIHAAQKLFLPAVFLHYIKKLLQRFRIEMHYFSLPGKLTSE